MNCFMGYNPLVTKQVKVTVWVCEQDGATPVAPSNPSEGDCFIVYATDEAVLSNTPTSAKTYTNGDWADAEGGGGGGGDSDFTTANITLSVKEGNTAQYNIDFFESWSDTRYTGACYSDENGLSTESVEVSVGSESVVENVYIVKDHYIVVTDTEADETFTITGNAEAYELVDPDTSTTWNAVKVYGDCTIQAVGVLG